MRLRQEDLEWLVLPVFGGREAARTEPRRAQDRPGHQVAQQRTGVSERDPAPPELAQSSTP